MKLRAWEAAPSWLPPRRTTDRLGLEALFADPGLFLDNSTSNINKVLTSSVSYDTTPTSWRAPFLALSLAWLCLTHLSVVSSEACLLSKSVPNAGWQAPISCLSTWRFLLCITIRGHFVVLWVMGLCCQGALDLPSVPPGPFTYNREVPRARAVGELLLLMGTCGVSSF